MSFSEIKEMRLAVNDPQDFTDLIEVADMSALPAAPAAQTAYKVASIGGYFSTDKLSGATSADYSLVDVFYSDATYQTIIDTLGMSKAICRAFHLIARKLLAQLNLVRVTVGAEVTQYQSIRDVYLYYKDLAADCKADNASDAGTNTGRFGQMKQPEIAGDLL